MHRHLTARVAAIGLAGVVLICGLLGCSTEDRRAAGPAQYDDNDDAPVHVILPAGRRYLHDPYAKKTCGKCHVDERSQELLKPVPSLCFECHKDFRKNFKTDDLHAPVLDGDCIACHAPHQSFVSNRLQKAAGHLCFDCHDKPAPALRMVHAPFAEGNCQACHTGHASTNRPLLRQPVAKLCATCHRPFENRFVHAPVDDGDCQACHVSHAGSAAGLLKKRGDALCIDCHDQKDMDAVRAHMNATDTRCISCHDAHASRHEKLLRRAPGTAP